MKEEEVDVRHNLQQYENVYKENSAKLKFHKDKVYGCYYYAFYCHSMIGVALKFDFKLHTFRIFYLKVFLELFFNFLFCWFTFLSIFLDINKENFRFQKKVPIFHLFLKMLFTVFFAN